jgi:hypothetical protein
MPANALARLRPMIIPRGGLPTGRIRCSQGRGVSRPIAQSDSHSLRGSLSATTTTECVQAAQVEMAPPPPGRKSGRPPSIPHRGASGAGGRAR